MNNITITKPGELAGMIPTVLGYTPKESVVVVSLRTNGIVGVVMRLDLADLANPDIREPLARSLGNHLVSDSARTATLLVYSDAITDGGREGAKYLRGVVEHKYVQASVEAFRVCGSTIAPLLPDGTEGRPEAIILAESANGTITAPKTERFRANAADRRTARDHRDRWAAKRTPDTVLEWRKASFERLMKAVARTAKDGPAKAVTAGEAGKMIAAFSDRRVRDAVLVGIAADETIALGVLDGSADEQVGPALSSILSQNDGVRPDINNIEPLWEVLERLVGYATEADQAPMLTLLALVSWWDGAKTTAGEYLDEVEAVDPSYRLAGLLRCTILAEIGPGWIRSSGQKTE